MRSAPLQSEISRSIYREVVGVVTGMQDDVDPSYTMVQFLETAIPAYCSELEREYNHGEPWAPAVLVTRGGVNPATRAAGDVWQLQSWISPSIRGRCYGTVNGMKTNHPTYTLRDLLETASNRHIAVLRRTHQGTGWIPRDRLRRGRPRGAQIPIP